VRVPTEKIESETEVIEEAKKEEPKTKGSVNNDFTQ